MSNNNYQKILEDVRNSEAEHGRDSGSVNLIVVSKTFEPDAIRPVLQAGARQFGENRVQEAMKKWPDLKQEFDNVVLHLIGPLQSNKTSEAVGLFDVIHTIDRPKIAAAITSEMKKQDRNPKLFVQVNTGGETQKAGIAPEDAVEFVKECREQFGLTISGLMCIPPFDENPGPHFALLSQLAEECDCSELSMGMSSDYQTAIQFGATDVRVGSAIFGARDYSQ